MMHKVDHTGRDTIIRISPRSEVQPLRERCACLGLTWYTKVEGPQGAQ